MFLNIDKTMKCDICECNISECFCCSPLECECEKHECKPRSDVTLI